MISAEPELVFCGTFRGSKTGWFSVFAVKPQKDREVEDNLEFHHLSVLELIAWEGHGLSVVISCLHTRTFYAVRWLLLRSEMLHWPPRDSLNINLYL